MGETAFLVASRQAQQTSVDVLADAAAERIAADPLAWRIRWEPVVEDERARTDCPDADVDVTFPDGTMLPGDRVRVDWSCEYQPIVTNGLWPGLVVHVQGQSVIRSGDDLVSP